MKFRTLASSSKGCCYIVSEEGCPPLLLECGVPMAKINAALQFQLQSIAGCLVTHLHGDHSKSMRQLLKEGVDIYTARATWDWYRAAHGAASTFCRDQTIEAMKAFHVGPWKVLPFDVVHDTPETLGFLIDSPGKDRLLFLTDSAYSKYTFPDVTIMAVECNWGEEELVKNVTDGTIHQSRASRTQRTHMSLSRLVQLMQKNDLSKVKEIHLLHLSAQNANAEKFRGRIMQETGKIVHIAGYDQ
jgi:phosphoribosyl 1,2-cyclic phosphodiesterase